MTDEKTLFVPRFCFGLSLRALEGKSQQPLNCNRSERGVNRIYVRAKRGLFSGLVQFAGSLAIEL